MDVRFASEPAPGGTSNEDAAFVAGNVVGVLDGVSIPEGVPTGCVHTAAWYVGRLVARLTLAQNESPDAPLTDLLATAIHLVRGDHGGTCDLAHPGTHAAAVCLLRQRQATAEYLILCDATLALDHGEVVRTVTDERFGLAVAELRRSAFAGAPAIGSADQRERVRQAALLRQQLTNQPGGYWIAAANPDAASHAITGNAPIEGAGRVHAAALLTDGASDAVDRYGLVDWRGLIDLVKRDGPSELIRRVRMAEDADGAGLNQPRYKRHDDATVAMCIFDREQP